MKYLSFFFPLLFVAILNDLSAQNAIWQDLQLKGTASHVTILGDGNYLVTGYYFSEGSLFEIYDKKGERVLSNVLSDFKNIRYSKELPNGNILHLGSSLFITNYNGEVIDVVLDDLRFYNTFESDDQLFLFDEAGSLMVLDFETLELINYDLSIMGKSLIGLVAFDDNTVGVCYDERKIIVSQVVTNDLFIQKMKLDGEVLWKVKLDHSHKWMEGLHLHPNGNIILNGSVIEDVNEGNWEGYVAMIDEKDGSLEWEKNFEIQSDFGKGIKNFKDIEFLDNGNLILGGTVGAIPIGPLTDLYIVSLDDKGDLVWELSYHIKGEGDMTRDLIVDDNEIILVGETQQSDYGLPSGFIVKLNELPNSIENLRAAEFKIYPNPVVDYIMIEDELMGDFKIKVLSESGQLLKTGNKKRISVADLPKGNYFIVVEGNDIVKNAKFVKM